MDETSPNLRSSNKDHRNFNVWHQHQPSKKCTFQETDNTARCRAYSIPSCQLPLDKSSLEAGIFVKPDHGDLISVREYGYEVLDWKGWGCQVPGCETVWVSRQRDYHRAANDSNDNFGHELIQSCKLSTTCTIIGLHLFQRMDPFQLSA